ncbi:MAG: hypothetical protein HY814_03800 [Candidatus Riflebacteria bacterium]|nr:hypothetical protein [Candidatus Riflebacteria bacterium]
MEELRVVAGRGSISRSLLPREVSGTEDDLRFLESLACGLEKFFLEVPSRPQWHNVILLLSLLGHTLEPVVPVLTRLNELAARNKSRFVHRVILFEPTRCDGTEFAAEDRVAQAAALIESIWAAGMSHPLASFQPYLQYYWPSGSPTGPPVAPLEPPVQAASAPGRDRSPPESGTHGLALEGDSRLGPGEPGLPPPLPSPGG